MKKTKVTKLCTRLLSAVLIVSFAIQTGGMNVEAEENGLSADGIVSMAGNSEMREYGETLESGAQTPQVKDEQISVTGTVYYVDSENGNDANSGTSESSPWKTVDKVNDIILEPGDAVLFKADGVWEDAGFVPQGSGSEESPILISSYGDGDMPKLKGNGNVADVILLKNDEYYEISNLDISNTVDGFTGTRNDENGEKLKDLRGIHVLGQDGGELNGYHFHDLYVHDVTGWVAWVSGQEVMEEPGIWKGKGWDLAKQTGGILFDVLDPETTEPTVFEDITIEDSVINNNSFGGIIIKQWIGDDNTGLHWGTREEGKSSGPPDYECENWKPHTNVVIEDNYLSQSKTDYGCDTILLMSVKDGLVQHNVSRKAGICGVELCSTDDITVQYNDISGTCSKAGGADSAGIDPDKMATNALIQYNYIHETGDGILLCGFIFGSAVARYNIIKDAQKEYVNIHGDLGSNYLYNNIFYNTQEKGEIKFIASSGGDKYFSGKGMHYISNNIFYNEAESTTSLIVKEGTATKYDTNCYYGAGSYVPKQDENAILEDPRFSRELGSEETLSEELTALTLLDSSPLINAGIEAADTDDAALSMPEKGTTDFYGQLLYKDAVDIGAAEYQGVDGLSTVSGYVTDEYGYRIDRAVVYAEGSGITATTDDNGFYALSGLTPGEYQIYVSKEMYDDGDKQNVTAQNKSVIKKDLQLGTSRATEGTVSGVVKNAQGTVYNAQVSIQSLEGTLVKSTLTGTDGTYTFENVPVGQDYILTASKDGYKESRHESVAVRPGAVTTVDMIMSKAVTDTTYALVDDFNDYESGIFAGNDIWKVVAPSEGKGSVTIVEDTEKEGNKYLRLEKNASGNAGFYNAADVGLTGTVTVEARVMRTAQGKSNQFGMYSYNSGDWDEANPIAGSKPMGTFALKNGEIITHNETGGSGTAVAGTYNLNEWHIVRNVMNLDTGTFDFYIDDMNTPVLANQPLRNIRSEVDWFLFYSNSAHTGDICVDYFRVCTGTPYDYSDASLAEVKSDDVVLELTGNGYRGTVQAETESVNILPSAVSRFAAVTVNGTEVAGEPVNVPLQDGENTINITVTAEDGITVKEYTVTITRESPEKQAYLLALGLQETGISPEFTKDAEIYTAEVDVRTEKVTLDYTPVSEKCRVDITVNGLNQGSQQEINLIEGENIIEIYVVSPDGTDNKTYTITVTREKLPEQAHIAVTQKSAVGLEVKFSHF